MKPGGCDPEKEKRVVKGATVPHGVGLILRKKTGVVSGRRRQPGRGAKGGARWRVQNSSRLGPSAYR